MENATITPSLLIFLNKIAKKKPINMPKPGVGSMAINVPIANPNAMELGEALVLARFFHVLIIFSIFIKNLTYVL